MPLTELAAPVGVQSILDTDLYKFTMQCAVLKHFPRVPVSYKFTNRTSHLKINRSAFDWLQSQVKALASLSLSSGELDWLRNTCPYLGDAYLEYLSNFRLNPDEHVRMAFVPADGKDSDEGDIELTIHGLWVDTILYEIYLLELVSEAYFKFVDRDWNHDGQREAAKEKGIQLLRAGCVFSEFGSRRRRDYKTHELVMQGLADAAADSAAQGLPGKWTGTSNVHLARKFGVNPIGTVAHEWFMGIAAITDDYARANEQALRYWVETFGRGVLGIALTDTFGTPAFLRAFQQPASKAATESNVNGEADDAATYAQVFTGVRQDSGDPLAFVPTMRKFYDSQGIHEKKLIVFSDSLNVERCIQYKTATDAAGLSPSFGVGTFFTNDYKNLTTGEKSVPMNIVIKLSEAAGRPSVKLSDDVGKNMGEEGLVARIKEEVGYTNHKWSGADEAHRWDK